MKKRFLITSVLIISVFFTSCISIPSRTSYMKKSDTPINYIMRLETAKVSNGVIEDENISNQMVEMINSLMMQNKIININESQETKLNVHISQKSYYKGINQYNTIFINYKLTTPSNEIILNNCYMVNTSDSIESTKVQYALSKELVSKINSFIKASNK